MPQPQLGSGVAQAEMDSVSEDDLAAPYKASTA